MKPALEPKGWACALSTNYLIDQNDEARWALVDGEISRPIPDYHAAAALALYGQPFGFTREDVRMLRLLAGVRGDVLKLDMREPMESLADRIEALLPPTA